MIELIVVIVLIAFAGAFLLPALAHTRPNVRAIQCISNLQRLQTGWRMYAADFADAMIPNSPISSSQPHTSWCNGVESWNAVDSNTNPVVITGALLGPYVGNQVSLFKCPADVIPSANGPRLRSYSMNGQMGNSGIPGFNPGYKAYAQLSDLGCPAPASAFIFLEEHPGTIADGWFELDLFQPRYADIPGSNHNGSLGISFADGHAELHRWVGKYLDIPVQYGVNLYSGANSSGLDADWIWLRQHAACPVGQ